VPSFDCDARELADLNVADASFLASIVAVNPTLTFIADALRLADRSEERPK
jgi:choline dehydrogenase-like flavoprotein